MYQLYFGDIPEEVERKLNSFFFESQKVESEYVGLLNLSFEGEGLKKMLRYLNFAKGIKSVDSNHPSNTLYLLHAIRVAHHTLACMSEPDVEVCSTALIHNYYEISGNNSEVLESYGFSRFTIEGVRLITVDRERQYQDDYLEEYYSNIHSFSKNLSFIRCLDKLDNLLSFDVVDDLLTRDRYIGGIKRFVVPLANKFFPELGEYIAEVAAYIEERGPDMDLASKYRELLKGRLN